MPANPPLYDIGDTLYFRESAALGFLEAVVISSVTSRGPGWIYTIRISIGGPQSVAHYGDRITHTHAKTLYYTEDELIPLCDALDLAEANAQRNLDRIRAQRATLCDDNPTAGGTIGTGGGGGQPGTGP